MLAGNVLHGHETAIIGLHRTRGEHVGVHEGRHAPAISVSTNPGLVDKLSVPLSTRTVISRLSTGWIIADAPHVLRKTGLHGRPRRLPSGHFTSGRSGRQSSAFW